MNKKLSALLFVVLALFTVVPAFAQDATPEASMLPTIAEIVVASASGDAPEFTTLLAAVSAADPSVLETLSNPELESKLTVFAPTDAAFAALQEALGEEAFGAILADTEMLTSILLYHVVGEPIMAAELVAGLEALGGALSVPTLNGQYIDAALTEEGGVTIDGANVVTTDIEASNGVIHVIDAVIVPESRTIAEIVTEMAAAEETPEFTTLLAAVAAADPAVLELLSDPEADVTVFAPTDAAFEAVGADTLATVLADQALLTSILQYHVVAGPVHPYVILNDMDMMGAVMSEDGLVVDTALEGQQIVVKAAMGDEGLTLTVNGANVVITDVDAANGVIHVIDAVLLPAS